MMSCYPLTHEGHQTDHGREEKLTPSAAREPPAPTEPD